MVNNIRNNWTREIFLIFGKRLYLNMRNNSHSRGFDARRQNKYSIRRFTVGTASIIVGATLLFGIGNEARAAEGTTDSTGNQTQVVRLVIQHHNQQKMLHQLKRLHRHKKHKQTQQINQLTNRLTNLLNQQHHKLIQKLQKHLQLVKL